jgi:hypothetical protein
MNQHIDLIDLREGQIIESSLFDGIDLGTAFTLMVDNKIICCAGVVNHRARVGECWLIASKDFRKYRYIICKTVKNFLKMLAPFYQRLQMSVREDFIEAQKFAEFVGFEKEGLMRNFDANNDNYFLYGKVKWQTQ